MIRIRAAAIAAVVALTLAACGGDGDNPTSPGGGQEPASVSRIDLAPATASVAVGRTTTLTATPRGANGQALTGRTLVWSSDAAAIATVSDNGIVTGVALGTAKITVTSEGKSAQATITVAAIPVASVTVAPNAPAIEVGKTVALTATLRDDANNVLAGRAVQWSSSVPAIATVNAETGVVTAVAAGTAKITATSEGKSGEATLTVSAAPAIPVAEVRVAGALDTLEAFDTRQLAAATLDGEGKPLAGRAIKWTSSNAAVATVDENSGLLTGVDRGTVTITATSEGKSATVSRVVVIRYRSISAGTMHACDIASGGIAWCWGLNGTDGRIGSGQIGDGMHSTSPVKVPGGHRFAQLSTYGRHTCGITVEGKAYCWGSNSWGVLGDGSNLGHSFTPVPVAGNLTFRSVSVGSDHSCGVATNDNAYCWGNGQWYQLGTGTSASTGTPSMVGGGHSWAKISAGAAFTCGVTTGNAAYCWGANSIGQIGDGGKIAYGNVYKNTPTQVVGGHSFQHVTLGNQYTCALTTAGQAYCWGADNTKLGYGNKGDSSSPVPVSGGHTFMSLSAGFGHACGVTAAFEVYCWGSNGSGQLGAPVTNSSGIPVRAGGTLNAVEVAASGIGTGSGSHSCAISKDRLTVSCWGRNDVGQLGNGSTTVAATPNVNPSIVIGQKPLPAN